MDNSQRIGFYCWAGPGLIRMTKLKYFNQRLDTQSVMSSYDYDYLAEVKEKFGITDFFATYSWGFSHETEKEDREFLISRLENFKKLGIRVHAYVQGPNLIFEDYKDKNWWATDEKGRLITYHRGRKVCDIYNPDYLHFLHNKIEEACQYDFDGIFIDNIQNGQMGIPGTHKKPIAFAGIYTDHSRFAFKKHSGEDIPLKFKSDLYKEYLKFRTESTTDFVRTLAKRVHNHGKQFGTNSFDPGQNTEYIFGTDLKALSQIQDYLLFETHSFPNLDLTKNHKYISYFLEEKKINTPVFLVSYRHGIGIDGEYTQDELNHAYSECNELGYNLLIKGSELFTNGVWHNLRINKYSKLEPVELNYENAPDGRVNLARKTMLFRLPLIRYFVKKYYNTLYRLFMESSKFRRVMNSFKVSI